MEKNNILKKAQTNQEDEYVEKVEGDGKKYAMFVVDVVCMIAYFYFSFIDDNNYAVIIGNKIPLRHLVILPYLTGTMIYNLFRYKKIKQKRNLIWGLFLAVGLIAFLVRLMMGGF